MTDLEHEIATMSSAYVGAAGTDIAVLRPPAVGAADRLTQRPLADDCGTWRRAPRSAARPHVDCDTAGVITGAHVIIYTKDADADRAFFRDVLGLDSVDAGRGWLIFKLPPAELAAHPGDSGDRHELYLMCDDVHATVHELEAKGVAISRRVTDAGFGLLTAITLPGGGELGLYEPRHPSPLFSS
jgi:predicted enzyme related to lactoylglutathione lyase